MVVGAFPVAKLGALIIRQVSKPLANAVKERAKSSPFFRTYVCMPPAQFYHWCEVKLKMWVMNLGKPVNIPKLNENQAIELGAELLGEGVIFTIAAGLLVNEYFRQSKKEEVKEEARLAELARIQNELKELYFSKAKTDAQLKELTRVLHHKFPDVSIKSVENYDSIPDHHRYETEEEDKVSLWGEIKGLSKKAFELVVPRTNKDESPPQKEYQISIVEQLSKVNSSSSGQGKSQGPSSSSSTSPSSTKDNKPQEKNKIWEVEPLKLQAPPKP